MNTQKFKELDYQYFLLAKKRIEINGSIEVGIIGTSMLPLYKNLPDQKIRIEPLNVQELKRFDVITFWQDNILITHYFWRKNNVFTGNDEEDEPIYLTRPLNPLTSHDIPIRLSQILGIVPERKIGLWLRFKIYFVGTFLNR